MYSQRRTLKPKQSHSLTPEEGPVPEKEERAEAETTMPETEPIEEDKKTENAETAEPELYDLDIPIAWRKGMRSCTKYPISNHLVYSWLSPNFRAFTVKVDEVKIPRNINEALQLPNSKKVVMEEMDALEKKWHMRSGESALKQESGRKQMGVYSKTQL